MPRPKRSQWRDVLELTFVDTNDDQRFMDGPKIADAENIVSFADRHRDSDFIAHCEQGISRSTAVCLGLEAMGWTIYWRNEGPRNANPLLVKLIGQVLGKTIIIPFYEKGIWAKGNLRW